MKSLGDAIRKRRLELDLRQKDVAEMIGCDTASITNWEKNRTEPRIVHLKKVVEFIGSEAFSKVMRPVFGSDQPGQSLHQGDGEALKRSDPSWGDRLIVLRKLRGMTQKELAAELGIDPSTLGKWERGARQPEGAFLVSIERHLDG